MAHSKPKINLPSIFISKCAIPNNIAETKIAGIILNLIFNLFNITPLNINSSTIGAKVMPQIIYIAEGSFIEDLSPIKKQNPIPI
jgi:hypothetical protein|nr:hypothetical protein [Clostridium cochlearium]